MQPTPPYNLAPATTLSRIESLADTILNEVGIAIEHHPPSLEALRNLGASITGERVHISGARIREFIRDKIPHTFTWQGRTLAHRFPKQTPYRILSIIVFKTLKTSKKPPPSEVPAEGMGDAVANVARVVRGRRF